MEIERRGTHGDLLHRLVRDGLPELRAALDAVDRRLPAWVTDELEAFVACGDPGRGFAWLECAPCHSAVLVPFSCKGRAFCPACCGRRMAERSAWLVERVVPHVATRQWVLTVPWKRRWLLARNPDLALGVLRIAIGRIERWYRRETGSNEGQGGAVTVIQRFGSSLALNLHFHIVALDGVYVTGGDGRPSFRQATRTNPMSRRSLRRSGAPRSGGSVDRATLRTTRWSRTRRTRARCCSRRLSRGWRRWARAPVSGFGGRSGWADGR